MPFIGVSPAYGKDYKTKKELMEGYDAGHDFQIHDFNHPEYGRYINKQDHPVGTTLMVRHNRNMRQTPIEKRK